jgi:hypothetical protein
VGQLSLPLLCGRRADQQIAGTPLIWVIMLAPLVPHRWKCA